MGMSCYINRINDVKLSTFEEFQEYYYTMQNYPDNLLDFRKHYWLDKFFRKECKNSRNYDEVILTKEDIEKLINKIKCALNGNKDIFDKDDFFDKDVVAELNNVLEKFTDLLTNENFEKDTLYYESCS
jgi:hypothetical protein